MSKGKCEGMRIFSELFSAFSEEHKNCYQMSRVSEFSVATNIKVHAFFLKRHGFDSAAVDGHSYKSAKRE